jgi:hypothetical protein
MIPRAATGSRGDKRKSPNKRGRILRCAGNIVKKKSDSFHTTIEMSPVCPQQKCPLVATNGWA